MRVTCYRAAHPSSWRLPQQLPNQLLPQSRNMRAQFCPLSQPSLFLVQLWLIQLESHRHLLLTFLPTANLHTGSGIRCSTLMCMITLSTSIHRTVVNLFPLLPPPHFLVLTTQLVISDFLLHTSLLWLCFLASIATSFIHPFPISTEITTFYSGFLLLLTWSSLL